MSAINESTIHNGDLPKCSNDKYNTEQQICANVFDEYNVKFGQANYENNKETVNPIVAPTETTSMTKKEKKDATKITKTIAMATETLTMTATMSRTVQTTISLYNKELRNKRFNDDFNEKTATLLLYKYKDDNDDKDQVDIECGYAD